MVATRIALDANILVLLAVGSVDKGALGRKRRVKEYVPEDYDLALSIVSGFRQAVVTPNVITECSDLLSDTSDEDEKRWLKEFVQEGQAVRVEKYVPSKETTKLPQYNYLGVADCSLLSLIDDSTVLLTTDSKLHAAASNINPECINFNHCRSFV